MNLRQLQITRSLNNRMGTRNGPKFSHDRQVYTGAEGVHAAAQRSAAMARRLEGRTRRRANVLDHGLAVVTVPVAFGPVLACRYGHP